MEQSIDAVRDLEETDFAAEPRDAEVWCFLFILIMGAQKNVHKLFIWTYKWTFVNFMHEAFDALIL